MSLGTRRRVALLICRVLQSALPPGLRPWGGAIAQEVAEIDDDNAALLFALHSLFGLAPRIILFQLARPLAALAGRDTRNGGMVDMGLYEGVVRRPQALGAACAVGAVLLGLAYMWAAGAPLRYLGINTGALAVGLGLLALSGGLVGVARRWPGALTLAMGVLLLATGLLGDRSEGAARWVAFGGLFIQPSLILLPAMVVGFARSRNALSAIGLIVAAAAMAIQPDRAMAGMLAAGLAVLAALRPDRWALPAFAASTLAFGITLVRPDTLPAMPYVDQILYSAFDVHALAGLAVLGGSILLVVPAIVGKLYDATHREAYSVFGIVWLAAILAAAIGNYPTPIVGYGGSAVLGYMLSLAMLPTATRACVGAEVSIRDQAPGQQPVDRHLCIGIALTS